MAKSPTELIRELSTDLRLLEVNNDSLREQLADLKTAGQQQSGEIAELRKENAALRLELAAARRDTDVLRQQFQDHLTQYQEWDRRRWGMFALLMGAMLTLSTGLIVSLTRK